MDFDYAVHSDFLIHWTGKDLDCAYDPNWRENGQSKTEGELTEKYLQRLRDTLRFGLWLTSETAQQARIGSKVIRIPDTPKTCFTELKLSESRKHARRYGRLGIGVKRKYVFDRCGRPVTYFNSLSRHDRFVESCVNKLEDRALLNFLKPMHREAAGNVSPWNYDFYAESEWRIVYLPELLDGTRVVDPRDESNAKANAFFRSLATTDQNRLQYLAPLDGWLAMVIYPSLSVKNEAQQNPKYEIQSEIQRIKDESKVEDGNWPIEVDLDACRNF